MFIFKVYAAKAFKGPHSEEVKPVFTADLQHMVTKGDLDAVERRAIIRSSVLLRKKYRADGSFEKFKAWLLTGGDGEDDELKRTCPLLPQRTHYC